jgi:putative FmdB family regulatory protein
MDGGRLMPTYTYRCEECWYEADASRRISDRNDAPNCPECYLDDFKEHPMVRIINKVNFARSTVQSEAHFDHTIGQVVRNAKDFEEALHRKNEEEGTHLVSADPTDPSVFGVTEEGMDETNRANTDSGRREGTTWL